MRLPCLVALVFSFWLMFHTFSYDGSKHQMLIAGKVWSDFGGHLPLIRSFTYGRNWPPQNPLYPSEPIRYHFFFYQLVGLLEQLGIRIDIALNALSILGFWGMLVLGYLTAKKLFTNRAVALLSVVFILFNGSLSFLKYFSKNGLTIKSLLAIPQTALYPSFGPWDGGPVAAIWNLNIFTNQRHLAPGIALALLVIYLLLRLKPATSPIRKSAIGVTLGLLVSLLIFINQAVFASVLVFLFFMFIFIPPIRLSLLTGALVSLPAFLFSRQLVNVNYLPAIDPGFLAGSHSTIRNFFLFWLHNLGLHLVLLPLGWLLSPRKAKLFILPILVLFFIVNYFRLSPDMFNNHKLLNFMVIFVYMYSALVVVRLVKIKPLVPLAVLLTCALTLSGVIDFFATKNDHYLVLNDIQADPDAAFFLTSTRPTDVVLNSNWFFHPASLAGRSIFSGYTYFTWSHGYDQSTREQQLIQIYRAPNKPTACQLLQSRGLSFVELKQDPEDYIKPNWQLWQQDFIPAYHNPQTGLKIYSVAQNCT